jgi:hypothetical protein
MDRKLSNITIVSAAFAALVFAGFAANADDVASHPHAPQASNLGPAQMYSEFSNDTLDVVRVRLAPHEKTGTHDVTPRPVIWLTDVHLRDTKPDGTTTDYRRGAGTVEWIPAQRHAGENLSDHAIEFLGVIPKPNGSAVK